MNTDIHYEEQCKKWHNELLNTFTDNNTNNLYRRLDEIEKIVNNLCYSYSFGNIFVVDIKQRNALTNLCNKDLGEHSIVRHAKCATQINNIDDYKKKARNRLNRWKPKAFGDYVLYEIIFINIYNYCYKIGQFHEWDDDDIKNLFVMIFYELLDSKIRFKKTRDVPLILSTAFSTNTRFRASCINFLGHFDELKSWQYKTGRAIEKCDSFKKCLKKIQNYQQTTIPPPIIIDIMDVQQNNRKCCGIYKHLIRNIIVNMEDNAFLNYDERISRNAFEGIIKIINDYHHYMMEFWTVTPVKPSQFISTYNDNMMDISSSNICEYPYNNYTLPPLNVNGNLFPIISAEEMNYDEVPGQYPMDIQHEQQQQYEQGMYEQLQYEQVMYDNNNNNNNGNNIVITNNTMLNIHLSNNQSQRPILGTNVNNMNVTNQQQQQQQQQQVVFVQNNSNEMVGFNQNHNNECRDNTEQFDRNQLNYNITNDDISMNDIHDRNDINDRNEMQMDSVPMMYQNDNNNNNNNNIFNQQQ